MEEEKKTLDELALEARQILHNVGNWEYEILGRYKIDRKESIKIVDVLEAFIDLVNEKKSEK